MNFRQLIIRNLRGIFEPMQHTSSAAPLRRWCFISLVFCSFIRNWKKTYLIAIQFQA